MPQVIAWAATAIGNAVLAATGSATIAAAATAVASTVLTVAATYAASSILAPKVGGSYGSQVDFKADPNAGIPYAIGETGVGGNIVFATTAETKNQHLLYLTVFTGAGPIEAITGFYANDEFVGFSADNAIGRYHNFMEERRQPGAQTPATFYPPATTLGAFTEWDDAHKLTGYAAQWWVLEYDTKKYPAGTPKPLTTGKWVKVYDPRLDSTYPGGSGAHRSNDEATWTWSENPFLHALTWCIGRRSNGKLILGVGAPVAMIAVAAFVEGANVCDANGWKAGGLVYSTDDKWQVLAAMLQAGGGWPTASGAKISCGVNTPRVSVATMTGADQAGGQVTVAAVRPRRDRFNAVIPRYRSAAHKFQIVAASKITVSGYLTEDGGEESRVEPELYLCPEVNQAAQLGTYAVANSREFGPIVVPCKPRWWGYRPNDCVTVNEPEWGLVGQKCLIVNRERDPMSGVVTLTLQTETDGKHAFALGTTGEAPPTPGLTGLDASVVPLPEGGSWGVTATYLAGADGTLPAIVITGAVDTGLVTAIIVDYREIPDVGDPGPWMTQEFPSTATTLVITGVKPNTVYEVRIRYRTSRGVDDPDDGTDLGEHETGDVGASTVGGLTTADFLAAFAEAEKISNAVSTQALKQSAIVEALKRLGFTPDGLPVGPFAKDTRELTDLTASDVSLIGIRTGGGTAFRLSATTLQDHNGDLLADTIDTLAADLGTAFAQISTETSLRVSGDSANASSITSLSSTVGGHTSTLTTHTSTLSTLDGRTQAYLEFHAAAGGDPAYAKILATGSGSAIMLAATEIALFNVSGGTIFPTLKLISGQAYFSNPVSVDISSKRLTIGPGFGASNDLVMWFGPNSTALGSMTKTNGYWAFATDGKVYYGSGELTAGGGPSATLNNTSPFYSSPGGGAGTKTTNTTTVTVTGNVGSPTYQWAASDEFVPTAPTSATTAFQRVMGANQDREGVGTCIVTVDGKQLILGCSLGIFLSP